MLFFLTISESIKCSTFVLIRTKEKYRGMFETQKVRKQDKFRRDWSQHKPRTNRYKVKFGNKVQISNGQNWCNVLSMEGVTVYGHHPECCVTFWERDLILFGKIPIPTIELP